MVLVSRRNVLRATLLTLATTSACIIVRERSVDSLDLTQPTQVNTPVKVHLRDGGVIVFSQGAIVSRDSITGMFGRLFDAARVQIGPASGAPLSDVVGAEVYSTQHSAGKTIAYSTLATVVGVPLFKVVFGSCPTIYSDSAGVPVLETESFSYSISPLIAKRDVDRLRVQADSAGQVRLEVRNEALETHYIDQLQLIEVPHRPGETVYPAAYGHPVAFRDAAPPASARDRSGRDVRGTIGYVDDAMFATATGTLARADDDDPLDWIDLSIPKPTADSVALVLRVRSSLLTTLLFYDYMLARPGAHALDWLATDMSKFLSVAKFGRWYGANLGLRIQVLVDGRYQQVARLADFGPIAWRHVAVMIPAEGADSVRIRLEFTADQWRIDQVNIATEVRRVRGRNIPLARVRTHTGDLVDDVRTQLIDADDGYVTTQPSQRFYAEFDAGRSAGPRTFLLAAEGYYTEWVRGEWLRNATQTEPFDPDRMKIGELLRDWRSAKDSLEAAFYSTRVPVL